MFESALKLDKIRFKRQSKNVLKLNRSVANLQVKRDQFVDEMITKVNLG